MSAVVGSDIGVAPIIGKITEQGALVAFMLLVILALAWFVRYLLQRNESQSKVITDALINNTAVISEFKEMVRASLHK